MIYPCCGAADLIHDTRNMSFTHQSETTTIPAVTGDFCPACGEVILEREQGDRYSAMVGAIAAERDSRILNEMHETARGLHGVGAISNRRMSEFNALCHLDARGMQPMPRGDVLSEGDERSQVNRSPNSTFDEKSQ